MELLSRQILQVNSTALTYHDLFGYPLTRDEMVRWLPRHIVKAAKVEYKNGYYFLEGRGELVAQRKFREKISKEKMKIARDASSVLTKIPSVKMVGVTGSLAMMNARAESDIDLMVVTTNNFLWVTRLLSYMVIWLYGYKTRKTGDRNEKDKLCLNIWMDETDLKIDKKNIYTAHEIAQIVPLINKDKTYERLLLENKWILDYWPKAVVIKNLKFIIYNSKFKNLWLLERIAFRLQYLFMKKKITREVVTPTRAFFHPFDWGDYVKARGF